MPTFSMTLTMKNGSSLSRLSFSRMMTMFFSGPVICKLSQTLCGEVNVRLGAAGASQVLANTGRAQNHSHVDPSLAAVNGSLSDSRIGIIEFAGAQTKIDKMRTSLGHLFAKSVEMPGFRGR